MIRITTLLTFLLVLVTASSSALGQTKRTGSAARQPGRVAPAILEEESTTQANPRSEQETAKEVALAAFAGIHPEDGYERMGVDFNAPDYGDMHDHGGPCNFCGQRGCRGGCSLLGGGLHEGPFGYGLFGGAYVRSEYLLWGMKGMNLPPLATTGATTGANAATAGFVNEDGSLGVNTTVLFGNGKIHSQARNGGRLTFGLWLDPNQKLALEGDYFALRDADTIFNGTSNGTTLLARPYFDQLLGGTPNTFDVAGPTVGNAAGTITDEVRTRFQGAGARLVYSACCDGGSSPSWWDGCPVDTCRCIKLIGGYRFLRLDDAVILQERHLINQTVRTGLDNFDTTNQFHGADLGTMVNFRRGRWTMDLMSKVALGNTRTTTQISGNTRFDGTLSASPGSILTTSSNIGTYQHNQLTMVPELGATLGYQIIPGLRATMGYSFIYWSQVYRAGDQISLIANPDLWPNAATATTAGRYPQYPHRTTDFWAQGLSLGLEGQW